MLGRSLVCFPLAPLFQHQFFLGQPHLMKTPLIATLLVATSPALAQTIPEESRELFRKHIVCIEENLPTYDDRISSAEVVARALVRVCESLAGQDSPGSPWAAEAVRDAAIVSVLRSRVRLRQPAASVEERRRRPSEERRERRSRRNR